VTLRVTPAELVNAAESSGNPGLLGKAPHWGRVRLGDVADVVNGAAFKSGYFNTHGDGMPLIRIRDVGAAGPGTWYDGPWEESHVVKRGDILVGMDGDFRVALWRSEPGLLNQRVCRIAVDPGRYSKRFLLHVLQGYLDAIWAATSSTTVKHLSSRSIADIPLPRPELGEQRRIVDILEDHLSRLDAADRSLRTALARLESLHAATIEQCMVQARSHPGTTIRSLGSLGTVGTGATPLKSERNYYLGGQIPWVTSGDLAQGLISKPTQFITNLALDETAVKLRPAGTLLVAMYGEGKTRGTVAELGFESTTNQACAAIVLHDQTPTHRGWVRLVLDSKYHAMRRLAAGGVQPNLNLGIVRALEVPVPEESVALMLMDLCSSQVEAEFRLRNELRASVARSHALRTALLRDAFAGRLDGTSSLATTAREMLHG
jgi:type I restriction enzyme, S subunit